MHDVEFITQRGDFVVANHGERWRVLFYDRDHQRHYAGSGPSVWIAIGMAWFERARRMSNGNHPLMARSADELQMLACQIASFERKGKSDGEVSKLSGRGHLGPDVEGGEAHAGRREAVADRKPRSRVQKRR